MPTGSLANALFLLSVTEPGERIMVLPRRFGGHGTYGEAGYAGARGLEVLEMPCTGSNSGEVDLDRLAGAVAPPRAALARRRQLVAALSLPAGGD